MEDECRELFPTNDHRDNLIALITKRGNILKEREEAWRLRSKEIWLKEGDDNSKFFHKFANGRNEINTIWKLMNEHGIEMDTFRQLATLATSHFKKISGSSQCHPSRGHKSSTTFSLVFRLGGCYGFE